MGKCKATSKGETGKSGRGQDIDLKCNKSGKHVVHQDSGVGAKFVKLGGLGDAVWPTR
jgi:hypothetical protein